jgi:hypothetical protein
MLMNCGGILMTLSNCNWFVIPNMRPKNTADAAASIGRHRPMITMARARKPRPFVMPRENDPLDSIAMNAPAMPASAPAMEVFM